MLSYLPSPMKKMNSRKLIARSSSYSSPNTSTKTKGQSSPTDVKYISLGDELEKRSHSSHSRLKSSLVMVCITAKDTYHPGETVSGIIIIDLFEDSIGSAQQKVKEVEIASLIVSCTGNEKSVVHYSTKSPNKKNTSHHYARETATVFHKEISVETLPETLAAPQHLECPFEFELPSNSPPTTSLKYRTSVCDLSYHIDAQLLGSIPIKTTTGFKVQLPSTPPGDEIYQPICCRE